MRRLIAGTGQKGTIAGLFSITDRVHDEYTIDTLTATEQVTVLAKDAIGLYDGGVLIGDSLEAALKDKCKIGIRKGFNMSLMLGREKLIFTTFNPQLCRKMVPQRSYDLRIDMVWIPNLNRKIPLVKCTRPEVDELDNIHEFLGRNVDPMEAVKEYLRL